MLVRAFTHTVKKLLPEPTPREKAITKVQKAIRKLDNRRPVHFGGRQMFCKQLMTLAQVRKKEGLPYPSTKDCIKTHAKLWKAKPSSSKRRHDRKAMIERAGTGEELDTMLAEKRELLAKLEAEKLEEDANRPPTHFASCKLRPEELGDWGNMFRSETFTSHANLNLLRAAAAQAPPKLTAAELDELRKVPLYEEEEGQNRPAWLGGVCGNRDYFTDCVFFYGPDHGNVAFKFEFARQDSYVVFFRRSQTNRSIFPTYRMLEATIGRTCPSRAGDISYLFKVWALCRGMSCPRTSTQTTSLLCRTSATQKIISSARTTRGHLSARILHASPSRRWCEQKEASGNLP